MLVVTLLRETVSTLIGALQLALLLRSIFSLFDPMGEGRFSSFLYVITEPIIYPIRALCAKFHWFEGTPIDMPFMLTWLVLLLVDLLISVLL